MTVMSRDSSDPNTWPVGEVRAYREEHGKFPDGIDMPGLNSPYALAEAAKRLPGADAALKGSGRQQVRTLMQDLPASVLEARERQQKVNDRLLQAAEVQRRERAEDRALLKSQTKYARQSRNASRLAAGVGIIAAFASVTTVVLTALLD